MPYIEQYPAGFGLAVDHPIDKRFETVDVTAASDNWLKTCYVGLIFFDKESNTHLKVTATDGTQIGLVTEELGSGVAETSVPLGSITVEAEHTTTILTPTNHIVLPLTTSDNKQIAEIPTSGILPSTTGFGVILPQAGQVYEITWSLAVYGALSNNPSSFSAYLYYDAISGDSTSGVPYIAASNIRSYQRWCPGL